MRITLVISSMQRGGAERVLSVLANAWAEQGRAVTLLTLDRDERPAYLLHAAVSLHNLGLPGGPARHLFQGLSRNISRLRALRRALRRSRPDLVISFMDRPNVLTLLASRGLGVPVAVSERTDPSHYDLGPLWNRLRRWSYRWADALVCQTQPVLAWFQQRTRVRRGYVIPNPVPRPPADPTLGPARKEWPARTLVAMGRLDASKGFDLLLQAFARVAPAHPDWSLQIGGQGPLLEQLRTQAKGLGQQVRFPGDVPNPAALFRTADLFVLPSRFEGFPNALCEAMACGLPAVAFDCSPGVAAIIRHDVDGILVPAQDVPALAAALDRLMSSASERARLAARAHEVLERFAPDRILQLWEELFREVGHSFSVPPAHQAAPGAREAR